MMETPLLFPVTREETNVGSSQEAGFLDPHERPKIKAIVATVFLAHAPYIRFVMYPFLLFSIWVHEMCHACAAVLVGGTLKGIDLHWNEGTTYWYPEDGYVLKKVVVSSAGYTGTAILGCFLLACRRKLRGPMIGLVVIASIMLCSCVAWIQNAFGLAATGSMSIAIFGMVHKAGPVSIYYLYTFLAATCSLNAIESVVDLFMFDFNIVTDDRKCAQITGVPHQFWAFCWLLCALCMSYIGLRYPFAATTTEQGVRQDAPHDVNPPPLGGAQPEQNGITEGYNPPLLLR